MRCKSYRRYGSELANALPAAADMSGIPVSRATLMERYGGPRRSPHRILLIATMSTIALTAVLGGLEDE